jgi:hypothetical protein
VDGSTAAQYMKTLSRLMVRAYCPHERDAQPADLAELQSDLKYVAGFNLSQWNDFVELANTNHVVVRALTVLRDAAVALHESKVAEQSELCLARETARIDNAIAKLEAICNALESCGCKVAVIKSLDHWPDLGSDLDLYTSATQPCVERVMQTTFGAHPVDRSWGDRLANKWNYSVPELPELVEVHVQFLGQTGEHAEMARRVIDRRVRQVIGNRSFYVPAPEERIVISTLQRVYRHFYFRLCDMIDMALLLQSESLDFNELHNSAQVAGIWPGVSTFLMLIQSYVRSYGGNLALPDRVVATARSRDEGVRFGNGFLRVSKLTATGLYVTQLLQAGRRGDGRALMRLPLLPPLAVSALVAHGLTGNDKGIW